MGMFFEAMMTSSIMGFSFDMDWIYLPPPRMLARQQQDDMLIMFKLGGSHAKLHWSRLQGEGG